MSYASILVHVETGSTSSDARLDLASGLARRFNATLIGLAAEAMRPPIVDAFGGAVLIGEVLAAEEEQIRSELEAAERKFRSHRGVQELSRPVAGLCRSTCPSAGPRGALRRPRRDRPRSRAAPRGHVSHTRPRRRDHGGRPTGACRSTRRRKARRQPCRSGLEGYPRGASCRLGRIAVSASCGSCPRR